MEKYFNYKTVLVAGLLSASVPLFAQNKGDEDKEMFNHASTRDQKAIDEAVNGWWTASMKEHEARIEWWREAKFGMFIHWGIYSLPGGEWKGKVVSGYAEHLMRKEKISRKEYLELAHQFNPVKFNADEWVKQAKNAGMNYFIITAKHHDGFAMFNSPVSDFDITDQTPFKRDPMAELAAACKKYGMKFGFYYSHAFDWEDPNAPGNDWEYNNPGGDKLLYGANWYDQRPDLLPKAVKYVDEKAIPQIKELLTKYHPDIIWFDTPHKLPFSENLRILKAIRETAPNVVVNGRLARNGSSNYGDYKNTGDRPAEFAPVEGDWEAIPTTNESYGYSKFDSSHKSVGFFVQLLAKAASRGGNLLMNIGPKGDGALDRKDVEILNGIGAWVDKNKTSVFNTTASPLSLPGWGVTTQHGNLVYLHVFEWPKDGRLHVGGIKSNIRNARLLTDPKKKNLKIEFENSADITILVPEKAPDPMNTVVVLEMDGDIEVDPVRLIASNVTTRLLAFDAELKGSKFSFGDGKSASYFVQGWKSKDQAISWNIRTTEPADYKVVIKYVATPETGGTYKIGVPDFTYEGTVEPAVKGNKIISQDAGIMRLPVGVTDLVISPLTISKPELMKLLEVQLIPVLKK